MERRALLRALGAAGTLAVAGCTDRSGSGSPTPTGTDPPSETPADPSGSPSPSETSGEPPDGDAVLWTHSMGGSVAEPPTFADDVLYVAGGANGKATPSSNHPAGPQTSQNLVALSPAGEERWRYESQRAMLQRPVRADGAVHVVTGWHNGYSGSENRVVRVRDGEAVWSTDPQGGTLSILAHEGGTLFVGTSDDAIGVSGERLFAVAADGTRRWEVESGDAFDGVVDDGTLYLDYGDRRTVAIDTSDGSTRWATDFGIPGPLTVFGDTLYLDRPDENENGDYPVVAVDATSGEERWRYGVDAEGRFVVTGAVEADGSVFVTEYDGLLVALDPADGTERWRYEVDAGTTETPAVHSGTVYLPAGGELHAVDAVAGETRWTASLGDHVWGAYPSEAGVVVRGRSGEQRGALAGYGSDGTEMWSFAGAADLTLPAVDGLRAYVGTESGYVAALGP